MLISRINTYQKVPGRVQTYGPKRLYLFTHFTTLIAWILLYCGCGITSNLLPIKHVSSRRIFHPLFVRIILHCVIGRATTGKQLLTCNITVSLPSNKIKHHSVLDCPGRLPPHFPTVFQPCGRMALLSIEDIFDSLMVSVCSSKLAKPSCCNLRCQLSREQICLNMFQPLFWPSYFWQFLIIR